MEAEPTGPKLRYPGLGDLGLLLDLVEVEPWKEHQEHALQELRRLGLLVHVGQTRAERNEYKLTTESAVLLHFVKAAIAQGFRQEHVDRYRATSLHYTFPEAGDGG